MSHFRPSYSFYLFSSPTFFEGMARIFDFGNSLESYNESRDEREADAKATYLDWRSVGEDLRAALGDYGRTRA